MRCMLRNSRGYGMYRAHINHMSELLMVMGGNTLLTRPLDCIVDVNDFNNYMYKRFVEKLKMRYSPPGINLTRQDKEAKSRPVCSYRILLIQMGFYHQGNKGSGQVDSASLRSCRNQMGYNNSLPW